MTVVPEPFRQVPQKEGVTHIDIKNSVEHAQEAKGDRGIYTSPDTCMKL